MPGILITDDTQSAGLAHRLREILIETQHCVEQ
jgi:hypothetical protein